MPGFAQFPTATPDGERAADIVGCPTANVNKKRGFLWFFAPPEFKYRPLPLLGSASSSYDADLAMWIGRLIAIGVIVILIAVPVLVIRSIRKTKREGGTRFYEGIEGVRAGGEPGPGEVRLTYHTYSGFLIYVVQ